MRWKGREQSSNVEDRRGVSPKMAMGGGGGLLMILVVLAMKFLGAPPAVQQMAGNIVNQVQHRNAAAPASGEGIHDDSRELISVVLHDTETVWTKLFEEQIQRTSY